MYRHIPRIAGRNRVAPVTDMESHLIDKLGSRRPGGINENL